MTATNLARFIGVILFTLLPSRILYGQMPFTAQTSKVYLGLLDDDREELANWKPGVAQKRLIRPAFEKAGSVWRSVNASRFPTRMTWTVAFEGRKLGQVESETLDAQSLTFVQAITTPAAAIPRVGEPSGSFAGLITYGPGKVRRPLVVISKPNVSDPDEWKRLSQPPERIAGIVRAAFRRDFPHVNHCKNEEIEQRNWQFPDSSLNLPISYSSNKGSYLVMTQLDAGDCGYIDDPNDPLSDPWFLISNDGQARRIGSFMSLLDAGDYDGDGRSELIFFLSQPEDTDGFILFDAELHKLASLIWTYH